MQDKTTVHNELLKFLKEIVKIATQGKIRSKNPNHQWRYGTIIDRAQRAIRILEDS